MESSSIDKHAATRSIPVYITPAMEESDEISLVDLWRVIARRKAIILGSLILSMLLAFAYLFFAEPMYKANTYLLPPQQLNIQGLLIDYRGVGERIDVNRYTQETVYGAFLDNLKSQGVRREFFDNHELIKHYAAGESAKDINADRIFEKLFNNRLQVQVNKQNTYFVTVSFSDSDPILAAQWLNQFVVFVNKQTVNQLFSDVGSAIQSEIGKARFQLDSKLKLAERRRLDTIIALKEALSVAKALGIQDNSTFPRMAGKNQLGLVVNTAHLPLYMRGTKALKTEISVLETRKSDEPFISGFRDLQERRAFLEGLSIDADALSAVTIDMVAKTPYRAESPRKLPLVFIAAVLGFIIGIFLVFVAEFWSKIYDEHEKAKA